MRPRTTRPTRLGDVHVTTIGDVEARLDYSGEKSTTDDKHGTKQLLSKNSETV